MPNLGVAEIMVIVVIALLVFGPDKLPDLGRQVGRAAREFRRMQSSLQSEVRDVLDPKPSSRIEAPKSNGSGTAPVDVATDPSAPPVD